MIRRLPISLALVATLLPAQLNRSAWDSTFLGGRGSGSAAATDGAYLGVTVWRVERGGRVQRVSKRSPLSAGDRFLITVESSRAGYLYVMDRNTAHPRQLFPSLAGDDNHVIPGMLVTLPATLEQFSYFQFSTDTVKFAAVLASHPMPEITAAQLETLQKVSKYPVARMDADLAPDPTAAEMNAMKDGSRHLAATDPAPQDLYYSTAPPGEPILVDLSSSLVREAGKRFDGLTGRFKGQPPYRKSPPEPPKPPPTRAPDPPAPRTSRVTAGTYLLPDQEEPPGYGLYSYVLFGARAESLDSTRWRRYYQTILAFFNLPSATEAGKYSPPERLNLTFFPIACSRAELPKSDLQPILFAFDPKRVEAHAQEHQAGGKPFAGHGKSNSDTACTLVSSYDYSRAQRLLAMLPGPHLEGPYILSTSQPLSRADSLPAQYLYQDLSSVPPELVGLWFKEFMAQSQEAEFWKRRTKEQFVLRLRTAIGIAGQQVPDFGNTITWAFLTTPRK